MHPACFTISYLPYFRSAHLLNDAPPSTKERNPWIDAYARLIICFLNYVVQLTYSMTRFAIYETVKNQWLQPDPSVAMPFYQKVLLGGFAGCIGGVVGTPGDMVNVR